MNSKSYIEDINKTINSYRKEVFKILNISPGEYFKIKYFYSDLGEDNINSLSKLYYFISEDLSVWFVSEEDVNNPIRSNITVLDFLNGMCQIIKTVNISEQEEIICKYLHLCGFEYILKSFIDSNLYVLEKNTDNRIPVKNIIAREDILKDKFINIKEETLYSIMDLINKKRSKY